MVKKIFLVALLASVGVSAIWGLSLLIYTGPGSGRDAVANAQSRSVNTAKTQFDTATMRLEADRIQGKITDDQYAGGMANARVLLANRQQIAQDPMPKGCPDNYDPQLHDGGNHASMGFAECKGGEFIPLHFGDPLEPATWEVRLYYFGKGELKTDLEKKVGKKLIPVAEEPDIRVQNEAHPGKSYVKTVGPHTREWMGFVKLVYSGNADYMELVRK